MKWRSLNLDLKMWCIGYIIISMDHSFLADLFPTINVRKMLKIHLCWGGGGGHAYACLVHNTISSLGLRPAPLWCASCVWGEVGLVSIAMITTEIYSMCRWTLMDVLVIYQESASTLEQKVKNNPYHKVRISLFKLVGKGCWICRVAKITLVLMDQSEAR
jgi:hypothetical protein